MKYSIQIPVYCYNKRYYITHPWKIFKDLKDAWKNVYSRARKGYAWVDLWNLDAYLGEMVPNAIDELADRSHGWPANKDWPEFEDWKNELHIMAKLLRLCNIDWFEENNDFWKTFDEWRDGSLLEPIKHLSGYKEYLFTDEELTRIDAELNKYHKMSIATNIMRKKLFARLAYIYPSLWD